MYCSRVFSLIILFSPLLLPTVTTNNRPETVRSRQASNNLKQTTVLEHGETVLEGTATGSDAASGVAKVFRNLDEITQMKKGDILVADMTDPDVSFLFLSV